jgi:hypothetical protein
VGYDTETEGIAGLWVTGTIVLSTSWVISVISSIAGGVSSGDGEPFLGIIPLAGPYVVYGVYGDEIEEDGLRALPIIFASLQNVGLIMIVLGVAIRHEVEVPRYATLGDGETAKLELGPIGLPAGAGLGLTLRAAD